jgi:hypothetical protein
MEHGDICSPYEENYNQETHTASSSENQAYDYYRGKDEANMHIQTP